jgi:hypothetical protein
VKEELFAFVLFYLYKIFLLNLFALLLPFLNCCH